MKAVLLKGYGGIDQLSYEDYPTPEPADGEVLVRVISTSVNPIDYKLRGGAMKDHMPLQFPAILGRDVAGEVTALGAGVTNFKPGDRVMGLVNRSYAEFLTAKASDLAPVPEALDPQDAGALPLVMLTGAQLIEKGVQPKSGEIILVTGASGSVGRTAVFVAKQQGAFVIAGVRAKQKSEAGATGADLVVAIDEEKEISDMPEVDAIADTVGGETLAGLVFKVKPGGRIASVVGPSPAAEKAGVPVNQVWAQPDAELVYSLASEFRDGGLPLVISDRFPLSDAGRAQEKAEKGSNGKILLLP